MPALRSALMLLVLVGGACDRPEPCGAGCGTAIIGVPADADVLFPPLSRTSVSAAINAQLYLKLADLGPDLNTTGDVGFVPRLARSWTLEDSVTIAFHIDPDARWHDGRAVTAGDVAFTWDVMRDPTVGASVGTLLDGVRSVEARDSLTAVVRFHRPYAEQFYDATHHVRILPRHVLDTIARAALGSHPVVRAPIGNGPYRLARWIPDELIELTAVEDFFQGTPGLARIIWRITPDGNTLIGQLEAGEVDVLEAVPGPDNVARIEATAHLRLEEIASGIYAYIGFNLRRPLFRDRALRRALVQGLDRDALLEAVLGRLGHVPRGPTTPMVWIWSGAPRQLPFDSAAARQTLDSLGWRDEDGNGVRERGGEALRFELLIPSTSALRQRAAVIAQEQWRQLGVAVEIVPVEFNTFTEREQAGRFDTHLAARFIDPVPSAMREFWSANAIGGLNADSYDSPVFDSLSAAATGARDPATARRLWHEALATINADAPGAWLLTPVQAAAIHRRFENVALRSDDWSATLWTWRVTPGAALPRDRAAP